jgi:undecaprenyl-diphosphatase
MAFLTRWHDDQSRPTWKEAGRDLAVRVALPLVVWWLVVLAIGWALTDGPLKELGNREERFNKWLASGRTSVLDGVTLFFSWTGATVSIIGVCLLVVALVWWRTRQWWYAVVPLIAISAQALVFFFTTLLIDRERPHVEKLDNSPPTSSFPSGHTGAATGLYFTLALMALRIRQPALRAVVVTVCLLVPFAVASARLYRGMHHLSDVTVAIVNGLVACVLAWGWLRREPAAEGDAVSAGSAGAESSAVTRASDPTPA